VRHTRGCDPIEVTPRELYPGLPVVFMTAAFRARTEAETHGAAGYLAKPFKVKELVRRVAGPGPTVAKSDPLEGAGPHPLDVPTEDQGLALAALNSGRWAVEPGTGTLTAHGEGPAPCAVLGLVRELRVRDWIMPDGELTVAGRYALTRWLDSATRR